MERIHSGELTGGTIAGQEGQQGESIVHDVENQDFVAATWVHKFAFTALGVADLFFWNSILNILYDIRDKVYPDYPSMTDTLNAVNVFSTLAVAIYTVKTGAMNLTLTTTAGAMISAACLLTAVIVEWAPGITGVVLLHIVNVLAGGCSGFYQTGGCALASVIGAGGLTGYVSTGQGITGVLTFVIWQIIKQANLSTKPALWILMGLGAFLALCSSFNFYTMTRRPEIATRAAQVKESLMHEATNPDAPSYKEIFSYCWQPIVATFISFYISLFIFPNIGPINWGEGDFTSYTLGCFQIGDLVGRYMPVLVPWTCLNVRWSLILACIRSVMLPLAILTWHWPDSVFWGSKVWHMILMAILSFTNGWIVSCVWIKTPTTLPQKDWRSRAMNLALLSTLTGISAGLWSARIFTAFAVK